MNKMEYKNKIKNMKYEKRNVKYTVNSAIMTGSEGVRKINSRK